jgi:hypothetical protein
MAMMAFTKPRPEHRDDRDGQQQRGERQQHVHTSHDHAVGGPPVEAGQQPERVPITTPMVTHTTPDSSETRAPYTIRENSSRRCRRCP